MGPSRSIYAVAVVALAALVGGALTVTGVLGVEGRSPAPEPLDPVAAEAQLGLRAAQDGALGSPRSLHARRDHDRGRTQSRNEASPRARHPAGAHLVIRVRAGSEIPIRRRPGGELVETVGDRTEFGSPTVLGAVRTAGSWVAVSTPKIGNGRLGWIRLDPRLIEVGWTARSIHVDLSKRTATLRERDRILRSFTVTIGAPGSRTPTGRFAVTDTFRGGLNPVYGCCAVALTATQPDLSPSWPGGDRIAIHGNGTGSPLGQALSNGCLRAADRDVNALVDEVDLGTPVFIF